MSYMQDTTDSMLLESGCYAFDRKTICQFQVWGVSDRMCTLLDVDGNWHDLVDCSFVRPGTLSVSAHRRRDMLFPKVDWNDQVTWEVTQINRKRHYRHRGAPAARKRKVA